MFNNYPDGMNAFNNEPQSPEYNSTRDDWLEDQASQLAEEWHQRIDAGGYVRRIDLDADELLAHAAASNLTPCQYLHNEAKNYVVDIEDEFAPLEGLSSW